MDYKLIWAEEALTDFEAIITHVAQTNPRAAEKLGNAMIRHIEVLSTFPRIGPRHPKAAHEGIREILSGKYRILYKVDDQLKSVEIVKIWHGAQDEPELPDLLN